MSSVFHADLWLDDRDGDPGLSAIFASYDALVHEITGGRLGHPKPK